MPNTVSQNKTAFEENIELLLEELELAIKWGRPSILLTVHKSKFGQDKASRALEKKLNSLGKSITQIVVNNERPDVPHSIVATAAADQSIFFVSNIDWGGGADGKEAYRALNIYRELFVENQIKAVFWLTAGEAANLARFAPDFWAFRHRVIEFAAQRTQGKVNVPAGILIWQIQDTMDLPDKPEQKIAARVEILAKLPRTNESLSTRIELLYNIGYFYWFLGNAVESEMALAAGLELAKDDDLAQIRSRLLNGIAIIDYEANQHDKAIELYKQAIANNPEDYTLLINLSAACCTVGRNQEALTTGKRATRMNPTDAKVWNRLGYIYCAVQKPEEAISCFTKATELAPQVTAYQESLAVGFSIVERVDEAKRVLLIAHQQAGNSSKPWPDIYEEAISGNPEKSLELLQKAIEGNQIYISEIRRNPNLNLLFEPSQIEAFFGWTQAPRSNRPVFGKL
jgi:tetratricopeptide (TPR) repeat protein